MSQPPQRQSHGVFSSVIGLLAALAFLYYVWYEPGQSDREAASIASGPATYNVSAGKLIADYDANEVAADAKYKGKVLRVTGNVSSISNDYEGRPSVSLESDSDDLWGSVLCYYSKDHSGYAARLSKGQQISVKGVCDGVLGAVQLVGCRP